MFFYGSIINDCKSYAGTFIVHEITNRFLSRGKTLFPFRFVLLFTELNTGKYRKNWFNNIYNDIIYVYGSTSEISIYSKKKVLLPRGLY